MCVQWYFTKHFSELSYHFFLKVQRSCFGQIARSPHIFYIYNFMFMMPYQRIENLGMFWFLQTTVARTTYRKITFTAC